MIRETLFQPKFVIQILIAVVGLIYKKEKEREGK